MSSRLDTLPLVQLTLVRLREFGREPEAVFWTFFFPILLAVALGIAFRNRGPERIHVGIEAGPGSAQVAAALASADGFATRMVEPAGAREALRRGEIALLVVPAAEGVTYHYDPTRPESRLARLAVDDALQRAAGRSDARPVMDLRVTEKGSRYIDFLIPGLIGLNLLGTGLWGVGFALVRMRTGKLLKRLAATPMRRADFLLSFMLSRLVFLAGELAAILLFARLVFDVSVRGSLAGVLLISTLGAFAFTGLGVLVASRARSIEAVQGLMNLVAVPMWVLSGVFFSSDHFPAAMQPFIRALPLTALVDALRAVMVEGAALVATAASLGIVLAWGVGSFAAALAVFRWR
ncbi:MAG: ABC transporter permease [Gemmatimonadetes bacterium]|nr:ABC transporter permease [Gemmatimonadota bacterium]